MEYIYIRWEIPFKTSRTLVVSAKTSKKYSGGVLRGSIVLGGETEGRRRG